MADDSVTPVGRPGRRPSPRAPAAESGTTPIVSGNTLPSLQPLTSTPDTDDMPGLQAVVQGQRLQQQLAESQVSDVVANLQQAATYSGDIRDHLADAAETLQKAHRAVPDIAREAVAAAADEARAQARYTAQGYLADPNYQSATQRPRDEATSPQTTPLGPMTYQEGRTIGGSIRQIGQQASARAAQWMSDNQPYVGAHLPEGEGTGAASVFSRVAGGLRNVGAGEGLAGGLTGAGLSGATKLLGPIGIAVGAATAGVNFMESQRAANLPYQQAFGTSNSAGYAQRAQEWLHGLSGIGNMGIGAAREQFQQVSQLGLQGDSRGQALDFMQDLYMRYGMQTADSIALVETAVQSGTVSLGSLRDSIDEVSQGAQEAGINVADAQKHFGELLTTVLGTVSAGSTAPTTATAFAEMSDQLANTPIKGLDLTQMLTGANVYSAAARMGVNPTVLQQRVFGGDTGAQGRVLGSLTGAFIQALIPDPRIRAEMSQWLSQNVPSGVPTPQDAMRMAQVFQRRYPGQVQLNADAIVAAATAFGMGGVTPVNALITVAWVLMGNPDLNLPSQGTPGDARSAQRAANGAAPMVADDPSNLFTGLRVTDPSAQEAQRQSFTSGLGFESSDLVSISPSGTPMAKDAEQNAALQAYYQYAMKHGHSALLDTLLSKSNVGDTLGASFSMRYQGGMHNYNIEQILQRPELIAALGRRSTHETLSDGTSRNPYSLVQGVSPGGGGLLGSAPQSIASGALSTVQRAIAAQQSQARFDVTVHVTDDRIRPSDVTVTQRSGMPNSRSAVPGEAYDPNSRRPRGATR